VNFRLLHVTVEPFMAKRERMRRLMSRISNASKIPPPTPRSYEDSRGGKFTNKTKPNKTKAKIPQKSVATKIAQKALLPLDHENSSTGRAINVLCYSHIDMALSNNSSYE